jgi:hypothetical protein
MAENEVTKQGTTDLSIFEGESSGFEGTSNETFKTPFMKILQALSPELDENDAKYIPGAKAGRFCNSATQQLYDELEVVILKVEHSLIGWKPNRGGFIGRWNKSQENEIVARKDGVQKWDSMDNEINDTIEFFCMNINDPADMFILTLSTASFKHGRTFATRLRLLKADGKPVNVSWAGVWKIGLVKESNDKGSWWTVGSTPEFLRFITKQEKEDLIDPAKKMLEAAEVDYQTIAGDQNEPGNDEEETF